VKQEINRKRIGKMNVFDEMGKYWAEMADQNQTAQQIEFLRKMLLTEGWILDVACGTGRHIIPLGKVGYNVVGLDISSSLLRIAKKRAGDVQLIKADMRFLPFRDEVFSAAVSMDTSFGYLLTEQDDLQCLKALREVLKDDCKLIVDVFNRERLISKYKTNGLRQLRWFLLPIMFRANRLGEWMVFHFFKWKEYPSFFLLQKRSIVEKGRKLHDLWVICDKEDGKIRVFEHNVRLYDSLQLKGILEKAGFAINGTYGGYDEQKISPSSSRLIFLAKGA
jgi:ubiquinone/menaquinone biosynthesis C-methylase UbiE